jgi:hypothetical protein
MEDGRDTSTLYSHFEHDANKCHTSKVDKLGRNSTSVKLNSWGKSLNMCRCWKHIYWIAFNRSLMSFKEIHQKNNGQNGYFDILLFSGRLATYLSKRLGHTLSNINTNIVVSQAHIVDVSS